MYFDITKFIDNSDTVQYNYYPTTFYKSQIQDTIAKNGFLKIPYSSKSNQPNIAVLGSGYVTKTLYIVKPIHKISCIDYDAELVIEHVPLTNFTSPLYTCFLLKGGNKDVFNDIDALIDGSQDATISLNKYIKTDRTIVYKNNLLNSATVAIFTRPIYVSNDFTGLHAGLFTLAPYVDEYSIMKSEPILGGVQKIIEGMDTGSLTSAMDTSNLDTSKLSTDSVSSVLSMDTGPTETTPPAFVAPMNADSGGPAPVVVAGYCQPIDETDPSISETAGVIIPMDSKIVTDDATSSTIKTMMNFFGFFIMIIIAFFVTPIAHKIMIVELIMDNMDFSAQRKLNRANAADVYTGAIFFGFALAFINYGMLNNKPIATILGMYVFIFFIASVIILQYQRIFSPAEYLQQFETKGVLPSFENMEMDWGFFSDNIFQLFFTTTMEKNPDPETAGKKPLIPVYHFQLGFLGVAIFYAAFLLLLRLLHLTGSMGHFFFTSLHFYGVLFAIYMMALLNHYRLQSSRANLTK